MRKAAEHKPTKDAHSDAGQLENSMASCCWRLVENGSIPEDAAPFPIDGKSYVAYAVRVWIQDGLHIGHVKSTKPRTPRVSYGGTIHKLQDTRYEVFCPKSSINFQLCHRGLIPQSSDRAPLHGGFESDGKPLYLGISLRSGYPGKIAQHLGGISTAYRKREVVETQGQIVLVSGEAFGRPGLSSLKLEDGMRRECMFDSPLAMPVKFKVGRDYLDSVSQLVNWKETDLSPDRIKPFNDDEKMEISVFEKTNKPLVLHCHDMKFGYNDYADVVYLEVFNSWDFVDIFCYFSHHRVTIPTAGWLNECRSRGKQCLGTLILEGPDGVLELDLLLKNSERAIKNLAQICKCLGFDGYLVNFESRTNDPDRVVSFIAALNAEIKKAVGQARGVVVYYDSLDHATGSVSYQNYLNERNYAMYASCDAIMTNYWWQPGRLEDNARLLASDQERYRVFVGVDVFARNTFYGHGSSSRYKVEDAVHIICKANFSVALFGPGYTIEQGPAHACVERDDIACARQNDRNYWKKLFQ